MTMRRSGHVKQAIWGGVLLAALAATAWTLRPQAVPATTVLVTRGALASMVSGEGRTRVRDLYVVAAPVDGELERVAVEPGDAIAANDTVAEIRPAASRPLDARSRAEAKAAAASAKAAGARAEAAVAEARVGLEHAESQLETARGLARSGSAPTQELTHRGHEAQMRRQALEAATAAAVQVRADLARAQAVLAAPDDAGLSIAVRSPAAGTILRVLRKSAGPIAAGTPLLEVGDVNRLEVDADLLSSDSAEVRRGAPATVTGWGGPQPLSARVRGIDPAAFTKVSALGLEEQRVRVVLDLAEPLPKGLGHDFRVDVAIVVWQGANVLRVPSTALFRSGEQWTVFTVRAGRARLVPIEIGRSDAKWTVVDRGLRAGDEVIVQPSDLISDGTRVQP